MYSEQRVNTFRASIERGDRLSALCQVCRRVSELDIRALADAFGLDFDHYANGPKIERRLKCRCGAHWPKVTCEYGDPEAGKKLWETGR